MVPNYVTTQTNIPILLVLWSGYQRVWIVIYRSVLGLQLLGCTRDCSVKLFVVLSPGRPAGESDRRKLLAKGVPPPRKTAKTCSEKPARLTGHRRTDGGAHTFSMELLIMPPGQFVIRNNLFLAHNRLLCLKRISLLDYIIIGSGFGGSVSALRLSEKGYSVLVIEQGKHYDTKDFPKTNWNLRKWMWVPALKMFGIQKLSFFRHISILSGVGVGGGSLVYANTLPKPKSPFFHHGSWAGLDRWEEKLAPHYETAWKMLGAAENPYLAPADLSLRDMAAKLGKADAFAPTKVSVFFGEKNKTVPDPYFDGRGPDRTGCIFCGACMTGCRHNAKNTLDKNYLHLARQAGAEILAEHKVIDIIPLSADGKDGYEVVFKRSTSWFGKKKRVRTKGVVFAGGVLGTVPLLLKLRSGSLPRLSDKVGKMVRTNNESLILNTVYDGPCRNKMSEGIAIGSILTLDENSHIEPVRYGRGSGFWGLLTVPVVNESGFFARTGKLLLKMMALLPRKLKLVSSDFAENTSILLFMQHLESTIGFRKGLFGMRSVAGKNKPTAFIPEALEFALKYARAVRAIPTVLFTESVSGIPSTAHILGGACMGASAREGVIDKDNKVFGYENMFVFDGSMISANPGVNPSLTITAITEYGMSKLPPKGSS